MGQASVPPAATALGAVARISAGGAQSLAVLTNGAVLAWGDQAGTLPAALARPILLATPASGAGGQRRLQLAQQHSTAGDISSSGSRQLQQASGVVGSPSDAFSAMVSGATTNMLLTAAGYIIAWGTPPLMTLGESTGELLGSQLAGATRSLWPPATHLLAGE
jgi:alpha-tubulin suppressor-like RCC1 family protein